GEGCGKSTQSKALYRKLLRLTVPALLAHEPGVTPVGKRISLWLKWGRLVASPETELMLFNASRAQLVADVIRPNLAAGKVVISDRYTDSTLAYQSYGRGLELATVSAVNNAATGGLKPDLTILLDIAVGDGLARKRGKKQDRFELEDIAFHERVREGYLKMAREEPGRFMVVDATLPQARVGEIIWGRVGCFLTGIEKAGLGKTP
ncbi:MAG: dTMP kinase, partial [Dehalococcoidales bacterium]|nr:dTMP kinase [Dehalococcoidales bacterium]